MPTRYAALLRGINVGGKNKMPMKDLALVFEAAGCSTVRTYIQSGNVVFTSGRPESELRGELESGIQQRFGFAVPVVLRTREELQVVLHANPFAEGESHVMFLADLPIPGKIATLDPNRSPGDTYTVMGREVYLHLPNGAGNSKLTNAYFDAKLATVSTARNCRTVAKILELMA